MGEINFHGKPNTDYRRPGIDTPEALENRELDQAFPLLQKAIEDMNPESFTLKELRDAFSVRGGKTPGMAARVSFQPSHLEELTQKGLIAEGGEKGVYRVTTKGMAFYEEESDEANHRNIVLPEEQD